MATVRMSVELRDTILRNVFRPFAERADAELGVAHKLLRDNMEQLREDIIKWFCAADNVSVEAYKAIPARWLGTARTAYISSINGANVRSVYSNVAITDIAFPQYMVTYNMTLELKGPQFDKYRVAAETAFAKAQEIRNEGDKAQGAVRKILNECNTLKQALEVYPPLEKWVPQDAMEQLRTKTTRKEQVKAVRERVDLSVLTQALIRSKVDSIGS